MVACFLCVLELYLSAGTRVQSVLSVFECLLGSFSVHVFSPYSTTGALHKLGRAVMLCRHPAVRPLVGCLSAAFSSPP